MLSHLLRPGSSSREEKRRAPRNPVSAASAHRAQRSASTVVDSARWVGRGAFSALNAKQGHCAPLSAVHRFAVRRLQQRRLWHKNAGRQCQQQARDQRKAPRGLAGCCTPARATNFAGYQASGVCAWQGVQLCVRVHCAVCSGCQASSSRLVRYRAIRSAPAGAAGLAAS